MRDPRTDPRPGDVLHLVRVRRGPFGGTLTTALCGRLRMLADGMNLTDDRSAVNCKMCLRKMARDAEVLHVAGEE